MGLAVLAIWLISSTIAAPIIMQKAIATGAQVGQGLATTATTAGIAGVTCRRGSGCVVRWLLEALPGLLQVPLLAEAPQSIGAAEASTSGSSYSPMGNLVGSLGSARGASRRPRKPKKNDPTGDDFVRELLLRSRN